MTLYAARLVFMFELSLYLFAKQKAKPKENGNKREKQKSLVSSWDPLALSAFRCAHSDPCDSCPSLRARRYAPPPSPSAALTPAHLHAHRPNASVRSDPLADHLSLSSSSVVCPPHQSPSLTPPSLCITPLRAGRKKWAAPPYSPS